MRALRPLSIAWLGARVALMAVLTICEPVVRFVLGVLAALMLLAATGWWADGPSHAFAVAGLTCGAAVLMVALALYRLLIRALAG